ncbi:MAG: TIGR01777 family oxidoreductase, partial [Planctomycetota bacterium]|nr:TIGR01777 family oxidoreductase [Planctomycetota bacterium]
EVPGLNDLDAVVHLAGENIAGGRWNAQRKARIRDSRGQGTLLLAEALAQLPKPPKVFISASAIGYYGDRGDEVLTEKSQPGTGFLADVCREWEAGAEPLRKKGVRVVNLRFGVVLSKDGGAIKQMLTPFKFGVGGILGNGKQYMSCLSLDDVVGIVQFALTHESLSGPVNAVCPTPLTNYEFTKTLGRALGRPTILPLPAFAARIALGEMADPLLLASDRVVPEALMTAGYKFLHPDVKTALDAVLAK